MWNLALRGEFTLSSQYTMLLIHMLSFSNLKLLNIAFCCPQRFAENIESDSKVLAIVLEKFYPKG